MEITDIEKKKGTRYTVYIDHEYWYIVDVQIIVDCGLKVGNTYNEDELLEIKRTADHRKAKERALYLLGYRDHSRRELIDKLCKSVDEDIAEDIADRMMELGFLDDRKYAEKLVQAYFLRKHLGARRVRYDVSMKGVDRDIVDECIKEALEEIDVIDIIRTLVERKYARYLGDQKGTKKTVDALMRLGHNYGDIKEVLDEYDDEY